MADAYHAMVHERPYKGALTHEEALADLPALDQAEQRLRERLSTIAGAIVLALLLMTKPFEVAFRPLFESKLDWAFRSRDRLPG